MIEAFSNYQVYLPKPLLQWNISSHKSHRYFFIFILLAHTFCIADMVSYFKVARVVNIKLGFMDWFFYRFIILIKQCKIPFKTLDKALLFSRNQVYCLKNWKLWRVLTTVEFNIFYWNIGHVSYLRKGVRDFFKFWLDLDLFAKIENDLLSTHLQKLVFLLTQDLNKIKKIPKPFRRH